MRRLSAFAAVAALAVPGYAWACKPVDVEAFYADALAAARWLWVIAGVLCVLICVTDIARSRLSKPAVVALLATLFFPAWTLPSLTFVSCVTVNVQGAVIVDALLAFLLARRLWRMIKARTKTGDGA